MKRGGKIGIAVLLIIVFLFVILQMYKKKRAKVDTDLLTDIQKMSEERDDIFRTHQNYIKSLDALKSKVKMIGDKLESKINLVRNADKAGELFRENQLWELALKNYEIGLEVFPNDGKLNYHMGLALANMGMIYFEKTAEYWKRAEQHYLNAIKYSPELSDPYYALSVLYVNYFEKNVNRDLLPNALNYNNVYIAKNPKSATGYFLRARILYNMGNKAMAKESYKIILGLVPEKSVEYAMALKNIKMLEQEEYNK